VPKAEKLQSKFQCLDAGFVFALELQFFAVLIGILWISRRWKKLPLALLYLTIAASMAYTFLITILFDTAPTLIPTSPKLALLQAGLFL
jgi:hypothetical protein